MSSLQEKKKALMSYVNSNTPIWSDINTELNTNSDRDKIITDYKIYGVEETNLFALDRLRYNTNASYSSITVEDNIMTINPVNTTTHYTNVAAQAGYVHISTKIYPVQHYTIEMRIKLLDGDNNVDIFIRPPGAPTSNMNISSYEIDSDGWINFSKTIHETSAAHDDHRLTIYVNGYNTSIDLESIKIIPHSSETTNERYSVSILSSGKNLLINELIAAENDSDMGWRYTEYYPGYAETTSTPNRYSYDLTRFMEPGKEYTLYFKMGPTKGTYPSWIYLITNDPNVYVTTLGSSGYGYVQLIGDFIYTQYANIVYMEGCEYKLSFSSNKPTNITEFNDRIRSFEFIRLVEGTPELKRIYIDAEYASQYIYNPSEVVIQKNVYEQKTGLKLPEIPQYGGYTTFNTLSSSKLQLKYYLKHFWSEEGNPITVPSTRNTNVEDYVITNTGDTEMGEYYNFFKKDQFSICCRNNATCTIDDNIMHVNTYGLTGPNLGGRGHVILSMSEIGPDIPQKLFVGLRIRVDNVGEYGDYIRIDLGINKYSIISTYLNNYTRDDDGFVYVSTEVDSNSFKKMGQFTIYANGNDISIDLDSFIVRDTRYSIPLMCSPKNIMPHSLSVNSRAWHNPTTMPNGDGSSYIYILNDILPYNTEITIQYKYKNSEFFNYFYILSNDPNFAEYTNTYDSSNGYYTCYFTTTYVNRFSFTFSMSEEYTYFLYTNATTEAAIKERLNKFEYLHITKGVPEKKLIYIEEPLQPGESIIKSQNRKLIDIPQFNSNTTYEIETENGSGTIAVKYS